MGKNWAICIGVNEYDNFKSLDFAQNDAKVIREFCLHEAGFEKVYFFAKNAPLIEADRGTPLKSKPTFGALVNFFCKRFKAPFLNTSDDLWFFFAGHGKRCQGKDYLMLSDSNSYDVEKTAISIQYVTQQLQKSGAGNIILIIDACRDEGERGEGIGSEIHKGIVSFYSCSPNESSFEIEELNQGVFTYCFIQGLRNNYVTVKRLDSYLCEQVPSINQKYMKPKQTPYTCIEPIMKQNLIMLPKYAELRDVELLKLDAYKALVSKDFKLAEQLWSRILGILPGDLDAISAMKYIGKEYIFPDVLESDSPLLNQINLLIKDKKGLTSKERSDLKLIHCSSDSKIDYRNLHDFLNKKQWKNANRETEKVMLVASRRTREGWLSSKSIHQFPLTVLQAIDQLWMRYSNNYFGFSVQKKIYERVRWQEKIFMKEVEWKKAALFGGVDSSPECDTFLRFNMDAPKGHLPMVFGGEHAWIFKCLK